MIEYLYQVRGTERVVKMLKQKKHNPYVNYSGEEYNGHSVRLLQVLYLYKVRNICSAGVAMHTGYAKSTVRSYACKYSNLLDDAITFFEEEIEVAFSTAPFEPNGYCAYIIECLDEHDRIVFLKVGKTKDYGKREPALLDSYKKHGVRKIDAKFFFNVLDDDDALTMENTLRKHYKQMGCEFIRNDRFKDAEFDFEEIMNDPIIKAQYELLGYSIDW